LCAYCISGAEKEMAEPGKFSVLGRI
jgi:hypothetical protein